MLLCGAACPRLSSLVLAFPRLSSNGEMGKWGYPLGLHSLRSYAERYPLGLRPLRLKKIYSSFQTW